VDKTVCVGEQLYGLNSYVLPTLMHFRLVKFDESTSNTCPQYQAIASRSGFPVLLPQVFALHQSDDPGFSATSKTCLAREAMLRSQFRTQGPATQVPGLLNSDKISRCILDFECHALKLSRLFRNVEDVSSARIDALSCYLLSQFRTRGKADQVPELLNSDIARDLSFTLHAMSVGSTAAFFPVHSKQILSFSEFAYVSFGG
jgi:hypothetical protein